MVDSCLFFFQAEDGIRDYKVTGVQTCALPIGPGLKALRHGADGKFYVLASPNPGLIVFSPEGKKLLAMKESSGLAPAALEELRKSGEVLTQFGEDCDVDSDGNIYVADRGANAVQVYAKEGRLLKTIPVNAPVAVAADRKSTLLNSSHLVISYAVFCLKKKNNL